MKTLTLVALLSAAAAGLSATSVAWAQDHSGPQAPAQPPRDVSQFNIQKGKPAINGYDPVAYFPVGGGKPAKGSKQFVAEHRGVTYWFASAANRDVFLKDPDAYEPEYGGWCATAMAAGDKVEIDPRNFKITGSRLFLFYKGLLGNALNDWNKDEPKLTGEADAAWSKLSGEKTAG
ncbi:MAG: YHS domain-containing (seleno)protein [Planctomycetota bacterium]|nr:YHS domain-containing (seleno)protein [Planctomycetota bacterium]